MIHLVSHIGTRSSYHAQSVTGVLQYCNLCFPLPLLQTRLVPDGITSHRHHHGKECTQGRRACRLHGEGGMNTHTIEGSLHGFLMVCVERRWLRCRLFPQGAPLDRSRTCARARTDTPHGPSYASSGALLTLLPKYRSKNNLPFPASPTP